MKDGGAAPLALAEACEKLPGARLVVEERVLSSELICMTMGRPLIMHRDANGHQPACISMGKGSSFEEATSSSSPSPPPLLLPILYLPSLQPPPPTPPLLSLLPSPFPHPPASVPLPLPSSSPCSCPLFLLPSAS